MCDAPREPRGHRVVDMSNDPSECATGRLRNLHVNCDLRFNHAFGHSIKTNYAKTCCAEVENLFTKKLTHGGGIVAQEFEDVSHRPLVTVVSAGGPGTSPIAATFVVATPSFAILEFTQTDSGAPPAAEFSFVLSDLSADVQSGLASVNQLASTAVKASAAQTLQVDVKFDTFTLSTTSGTARVTVTYALSAPAPRCSGCRRVFPY